MQYNKINAHWFRNVLVLLWTSEVSRRTERSNTMADELRADSFVRPDAAGNGAQDPEREAQGLFSREVEMLQRGIVTGATDRAQNVVNDWQTTALELSLSASAGFLLSAAAKKGGLAGDLAKTVAYGVLATDVVRRGVPTVNAMIDTAVNPASASANSEVVARNLGSAVVDYPLMAASGLVGAKLHGLTVSPKMDFIKVGPSDLGLSAADVPSPSTLKRLPGLSAELNGPRGMQIMPEGNLAKIPTEMPVAYKLGEGPQLHIPEGLGKRLDAMRPALSGAKPGSGDLRQYSLPSGSPKIEVSPELAKMLDAARNAKINGLPPDFAIAMYSRTIIPSPTSVIAASTLPSLERGAVGAVKAYFEPEADK